MATTGDRIREVRESLGMTQEELADQTALSKGFISDVENNKRGISAENLLRIANVLHASMDYLASGAPGGPTRPRAVEIPHDLSVAAEQLNLSYAQTLELLDAYQSVIARRSNRQVAPFDVDQWKRLHSAIQKVFSGAEEK
jgi:transcriptional regulator with XRE-family HTH domain